MAQASSNEGAVKEAKERMKNEFDYVRLTWHDLYGTPRSCTVPGRHANRVIPGGYGIYEGSLYEGPSSDMSPELHQIHQERLGEHSGNISCIPDCPTLRYIPWAGGEKYKVGEMMCTLVAKDGIPLPTAPRRVAQIQMERLETIGLKIMSALEIEFTLEDQKTNKPVADGFYKLSPLFFAPHERMLFDLDQQLQKAGIDCERFEAEFGPGQFEIATIPAFGVEAMDACYTLKECLKENAHKYSLEASFMAKTYPKSPGNGAHFNFSIWDENKTTNILWDENDPLRLSTFARHFIAGLMHHGRALSALQSPTVNCYRRLQSSWAPSKVCWGIDNRNCALRITNASASKTYMENRLPSGSANYYLVLASTVAAGLSGVEQKLELPPPGLEHSKTLPLTLSEALTALEQDEVLVNALGKEFIEWFCIVKRHVDLDLLRDSDVNNFTMEALAKERQMYNATM